MLNCVDLHKKRMSKGLLLRNVAEQIYAENREEKKEKKLIFFHLHSSNLAVRWECVSTEIFFLFHAISRLWGCFYRNQIQTSIHLSPPLILSATEWRNTKILFVLLSSTLMDTLQLLAPLPAPLFNQVTLTMIMNKYSLPLFSFICKLAFCFPSTAVREKTLGK